jgi:hypothetical protein
MNVIAPYIVFGWQIIMVCLIIAHFVLFVFGRSIEKQRWLRIQYALFMVTMTTMVIGGILIIFL